MVSDPLLSKHQTHSFCLYITLSEVVQVQGLCTRCILYLKFAFSFTFFLPTAAQIIPTHIHRHNPKPHGPHLAVKPDQKEVNDQQPVALKHITRTK